MKSSIRAGQHPLQSDLVNIPYLITEYYGIEPDRGNPAQQVIFGTSGHRGSASQGSFNEKHILAIAQAIADYRKQKGITGPCFIGKDTHALSEPALMTVLEVLVANQIHCIIQPENGFTPTPAISYAILQHNIQHSPQQADGIVITPSHNPPADGGIKYNPPHGGPAGSEETKSIEQRANALLAESTMTVKRVAMQDVLKSEYVIQQDMMMPYVKDLKNIIDFDVIKQSGIRLGVDPLGGAGVAYWPAIKEYYGIDLTIVNDTVDPTFRFMTLDSDGEIRMDCSSSSAMASLLSLRHQFDLAFAADTDHDRHGIVTPEGLMNPNHYLAVAIDYLFSHRPLWSSTLAIGKTLVSSAMIDRVAKRLGRTLFEVPVGFKWFVDGLFHHQLGFVGEESAGATFLRFNGQTWTTDKDGIVMGLLAAEIQAKMKMNPQQYYQRLADELGSPYYLRIQRAATFEQKQQLGKLSPSDVKQKNLAGDAITQVLTHATGNQASIGGIKVMTENGWFTARPSGTENAYKIYCESFISEAHLQRIAEEAAVIVDHVLA